MFKVNLADKMISGQIITKQEKLSLEEAQSILDKSKDDDIYIFKNLGLGHNLEEYNSINSLSEYLSKFNNSKVFHESTIKRLCGIYQLRFLTSDLFKGELDPEIPSKIKEFTKAYHISVDSTNCFIMAPKSSFKLSKIPKDPLMFIKIADNYYYLIHKWGNDLNTLRKITGPYLGFFGSGSPSIVVFAFVVFSSLIIASILFLSHDITMKFALYLEIGLILLSLLITYILGRYINMDNYNSKFDN